MNKNDLRYIKTEQIIRKSFIACIKKNGFEKTTVSMICAEGLISRNAFYLHFTDKYDLLDRLFDEFRARLISNFVSNTAGSMKAKDILDLTNKYLDVIEENKSDFLFLMKCSRERMENVIHEIIIEMPARKIIPDYEKKVSNIKTMLNIRYMFTAMVAFTELWLKNTDKISKEDAAFELYQLCEKATMMFYNALDL